MRNEGFDIEKSGRHAEKICIRV